MGFNFRLSKRSLRNLQDVHPDLARCVHRALALSDVDFCVHEGLRSKARQQKLFERGASRTLHSKHLTGHAVDLVPVVGKLPTWRWELIYQVAGSMRRAASELGLMDQIVWGGCWWRLSSLTIIERNVAAYVQQCNSEGRKPFCDGPHFEWVG